VLALGFTNLLKVDFKQWMYSSFVSIGEISLGNSFIIRAFIDCHFNFGSLK